MEQIMTTTATRIHPLMAAAAASVIIVSLTGAAAITGLLPSSRSAPEPQAAMTPAGMPLAAPVPNAQLQAATQTLNAYGQPSATAQYAAPAAPMVVSAAPGTTTYIQSASNPAAPMVIVKQEAAPVVKQTVVQKPRVVERIVERRVVEHRPARQVTRYEQPVYRQAPAPAQPNYVGIGTGAVIGGLIGNQVGGGNGKKLATLAGIIGGGFVGNEVAKRNSQ
jgi:uncharacterized protein YcfJ